MNFRLGIKSDPVEYRYSFEWLFDLMQKAGVSYLQLGSFFELYSLPDDYFIDLRALAAQRGVRIKSVFTAHRELGGFFSGDRRLESVARRNYERLIEIASLVGADYAGSNPGAVYRDRPHAKESGIRTYLAHMKELAWTAKARGLSALTIEPMSCLSEPPSTPQEISRMMSELSAHHSANPGTTVPVLLCGDVSHGVADPAGEVVHGNMELFEYGIPWMCEFHFKNTDRMFGSTFGFGEAERGRGIVDVRKIVETVHERRDAWPVDEVVGYLEIGGPKLGRDYSDHLLGTQLQESIEHIARCMTTHPSTARDQTTITRR